MKQKRVKNSSTNLKERKNDKDIKNKIENKNNKKKGNSITINNRINNKNIIKKDKKEELTVINTIQNLQTRKIKNINSKFSNINNKNIQNKKLNKLDPNTYNEDYYSTKRDKKSYFSDIKMKKMKSKFDSIILDNKKETPIYKNKLNNIISRINKFEKRIRGNNSYIFNKDNNIIKRKNLEKDINNCNNTIKNINIKNNLFEGVKMNEINREFFKSFQINKISTSFIKEPFNIDDKYDKLKNRYENNHRKRKKKERKFTKSFENKKFIKQNNKNDLIVIKSKINNYNSSLESKRIRKEKDKNIDNNRYQMTDYFSSFNSTLPITINKIKFGKNNKVKTKNSFERIKSHKILITNININLYKEKEKENKKCDEEKIKLNLKTEENNIDLEKVYLLEEKVLKIMNKINEYNPCDEECHNWISFYFGINFYSQELNLFKNKNNYKKIYDYIKLEIICYFLCYDISLNQNFCKASFLLKAIMNILHENYLIIISFFLYVYKNDYKDNNKNDLWINKIEEILENELKIKLNSQDMNEDSITSLIFNSIKNIYNYYNMMIDNLYSIENSENIINKNNFPNCLKLKENNIDQKKKTIIVSLFFSEVKEYLNKYSFENMKLFFYLYLNNQKYNNIKQNKNKNENKKDSNTKQYKQYYLSPIKQRYRYTLLINLDKTLIFNNNNKIILRPNIFYFLSKVKEMYEIIAFSFDSDSIIDEALKLIENKTKYFDYVLNSEQLSINYNGKLIKNLENIGRDIKNIIVIDNKINIHKKFKNNLILIKGFYGDVSKDINTLKILGYILQNVKNDNCEDDIRIRIKKYKNMIKTYLDNNK